MRGSVSDGLRPGLARAGRTHSLEGWTRGPVLSFLAMEAVLVGDDDEADGDADRTGARGAGFTFDGEGGAGAVGASRDDCDLEVEGAGLRLDEEAARGRWAMLRCPASEELEGPGEASMDAMAGDDVAIR